MKRVHFIGIGGIGTSALAAVYLNRGVQVSGSDQQLNDLTKELINNGAQITEGHQSKNITDQELVIYSPAIPDNNPELLAAKEKNIKTLTYPEALGDLSQEYFTIAISGTHGKSTTTAMTAVTLEEAGLDPTVIVGTKITQLNNKNYRIGKSKYLIIEACEYKESFKHLKPQILIITNIEAEHLDYYKTEENYINSFKELCQSLPETSQVIIQAKDKNSLEATKNIKAQTHQLSGAPHLTNLPGKHNQENALNTYFLATKLLKIPKETATNALQNFQGTWRRMEYLGKKGSTHFYDDYAHHPTEIKATLNALREHYGQDSKILTIFQPHQYSRTANLLKDFAKSFNDTNQVIIPNIYKVRDTEEDLKKITPEQLVEEIGDKAVYGNGLQATESWLQENYNKFNVVVIMGAGNVTQLRSICSTSR